MDSHTEDETVDKEISSPKTKGRSLPTEQHYFRFERQRNMLSDEGQTSLEKDRHRFRERQRRQNMTEEQRSLERERRRLRDEQRRKSMSDEQRLLEKERRRNRERQRRINMNDEQRAVEMERRRIRERQHRQNMNDEQRSRDRERRRQRDRQRRENMNDEQKAQERERRRLYGQQKRGNLTANQFLMSQLEKISGGCEGEQDSQNASYSTDGTDGNQTHTLMQDNLQIEMINTSERSSTTTLNFNTGTMVVSGNDVVGSQNPSSLMDVAYGNRILSVEHDNMQVDVTNTSGHSSKTTLDHNESAVAVYNGDDGNNNVSYSTDVTDAKKILALKQGNLKGEVNNSSEPNSTTTLDLNENSMVVFKGHEIIDIHIEDEGNAGEDDKEC